MASALSAFVKGDKEIKDRLESMDSTLKKIYTAQEKYYGAEDKHRRRQEQAAKRAKADTKAPGSIFKKGDKEEKKKGGWLGKLFGNLLKNPAVIKFLAALGAVTAAAWALNKAFNDLKEGTVIWWREVKRQWTEGFAEQKRKWAQWWDDFKVKSSKNWDNFKTKTNKLFDDIWNSRSFKDFKKGLQEAGEQITKKFPRLGKSLDDISTRFKNLGKGVTKKGGLVDVLTNNKVSKGLGKNLGRLGKRLPAIGELLFAGVTLKERMVDEKQGAGQAFMGTGAEVVGGLAGAAAGGKAGGALGALIGSMAGPIGTAIGGGIGAFSGAVIGGFGGAEFLGGLSDKLYPMIEGWVQDTIIEPFRGFMEDVGKFWQVNVVEPFMNNPVVQWLTPIVQAAMDLGKAFWDFQVALAGFLGRAAKKWFEFVGNIFKGAWDGITNFNKKLVESAGKIFGWVGDKFDAWYKKDVEPWWKGLTEGISEFLEPVRKHFEFVGEKAEELGNFLKDTVIGTFTTLTDLLQKGLIGMLDAPKNALNWLTGKLTGKQTGGPVNVPGTGSGDKVPMMLPSGSFVMNRNAVHRQEGGMVPTLLEPGEQVYMPGQWNGMHMAMNSMFPRFQTGGEVTSVTHPATGSGYQPAGATDSHGRPIVFSKEAAESFAKMMATGNVKGSDVASSKRSPADNKRVGGVPNSAHLYGEAMDIHGSSKQWLIGNSEKYGWIRNNYMHDSWHWDYKGGGSGAEEPPTGPVPMILAAGTNDVGNPIPAGKNVHDMIKVAKGKNYDVNFISPTANGRFAEVSQQTSQQARVAGANTYMPQAWDTDGYHIAMAEAGNIKGKWPGAMVIGDSNAARIEGTNGTAGRTKVGAGTSEIKGFIDGLTGGVHNESGESEKLGNNRNAVTAGNLGKGLLNLGGDLGEFFTTLMGGLGEILGDLGGGLLGAIANYGNNGGGNNNAGDPGDTNSVSGSAGGDMVAGAKKLMEAGVPKVGAAYLAGNIQQESAWKGQRDWGGVYNPTTGAMDGTSRNGGLVSWASWANDPARLGKIEKHLGKNIKEASDGEQINAMLWEMKNDYPGSYKVFMNPNATPAQLKDASYKYWGYGHEGARFQYSSEILPQLKRGGVVPPATEFQGRQSGGTVSAKPVSSSMMNKSQEQFLDKLTSAQTPIIVPMPMGGGGNAGQAHGGAGGGQTNVPDLPSHPSGNVALDNAFRLSLGASFA